MGLNVESVSVFYSPETGKGLDKNSGGNLRLGVEHLTAAVNQSAV